MNWKERLTAARERKHLNKTQFAKEVGVSAPTVTDWEKPVEEGGIHKINGVNLDRVCQVLGITSQWLYAGIDQPTGTLEAGIELLRLFSKMTPDSQLRLLDIARHEVGELGGRNAANDQ